MTQARWWMVIGSLLARSVDVAAQAPGLPVINSGVAKGLTLAALVGFPNGAAGGGTALGASGMIGLRRIAFGGFISSQSGSQYLDRGYARGGSLVVKLAGGPLVPVSVNLQGGFSYSKTPTAAKLSYWHVPVGLGISWTIPRPVVALKPWLSPRLDYRRVGPLESAPSASSTDFGLSGGISFGFLNGLGIDVAFDRIFSDVSPTPTTVGVGLSYTIK